MTSLKATQAILATTSLAILTLSILLTCRNVDAQSTKGGQQTPNSLSRNTYGSAPATAPAPSPVAQLRQQQQQQQQSYAQPANRPVATPTSSSSSGIKRPRQQQQQQQRQEQQQPIQTQQRYDGESVASSATEDPLSDSEPALYGSVAGAPGVDFPGYTRIPKTSFTCEGKGFDFGFYADEETGCQVYHVCWSGRRESFLCGVGTVFNQAILACDYWHSVDCSKSSQFYGVNSELGKAGAEPASGGLQRISSQSTRNNQATLPTSSTTTSLASPAQVGYGNRPQQQQGPIQQQQQQSYNNDESNNFDAQPQQQQQQVNVIDSYSSTKGPSNEAPVIPVRPQAPARNENSYGPATFAPQRATPVNNNDYQQQQQRVVNTSPAETKGQARINNIPIQPLTTQPTPPVKRARFNMDFNQKVNSLIDSPVRPPIKSQPPSNPIKQRQQQQQQQPSRPANFAQLAVSRAQQSGSQTLNLPARNFGKTNNIQQQQIQQKQSYDNDIDEQPQQQQQQTFDDSPVQTSTAPNYGSGRQSVSAPPTPNNFIPQQLIIHSGGGPDGSSAITTQYDTLSGPANSPNNQINNQPQQQQQQQGSYSSSEQPYESSVNDESSSNSSDDFRSSGAKAAASHNQNWYIMRAI